MRGSGSHVEARGAGVVQAGAVAAALGGGAWMVKAVAILATGQQPALLFEVAPVLFGIGVVGLWGHTAREATLLGRLGGASAAIAVVAASADLFVGPASTSDSDFSPLTFLAFVAVLVSLVLLGLVVLRRALLAPPAHRLPLVLGVVTFPFVALGGALSAVHERLLEVPVLILGAVWVWLGVALWRAATVRPAGPAPAA